jgi:hypothetical protein
MDPQTTDKPVPVNPNNPLQTMQPGEEIITEIKRHPIGMLLIYATVGFTLIALAVILFGLAPSMANSNNRGAITSISVVIFLIIAVVSLGFTFIANYVYWGNRWIVTSDSITQIAQISLFNKQASQLSLKNVEDISSTKTGILQHLFNYGTIKAETANERTHFTFTYCPRPEEYAQRIIEAHEKFAVYVRQHQQDHTQSAQMSSTDTSLPERAQEE